MARGKNRRMPGDRMPRGRPANQKKPRWLTSVHWLIFASGWIAAALVGVLELPAKIVSFSENFSPAKEATLNAAIDYQKYVGRFSSDPNAWVGRNLISDGTHPPDDGDIQLEIEYLGQGEYRGEIRSAYMAKHALAPWSRVMIDGKVGLTGTFRGVVWDIVNGRRVSYALFRLSPEDKANGSLRLTPTSANNIFPGEVVLWPTDFKMSGGERGQCFDDLLHEVVARPPNKENAKKVDRQSDP
ncbi:hypothetical protein [Oleiagrimonas sp. C23AA]|uniref:hypothetical protein n=1 Tax=Oleiagrimonas sp. C23AA TaxID=2719047 RepID=UPI001423F51B|nr:hypothetical protein [Oleiagrimonas sp. C23AA]NII10736.1 hypothetical protein [Oleiagrimonas sp. C23AA]